MDAFHELRHRRAEGQLTDTQYEQALALVTAPPAPDAWRDFVWRTGLALGTCAVLAGVIYLFAWNWSGLGRFTKLGLGAGTVLVAAGLASGFGLSELPGRLAGAASCGFAGALFVLYSQVYQTGADPWELFAAFSVVCIPYTLATGLPAVGSAGLVAAQIAVLLAWTQLHPWEQAGWAWFSVLWAVFHVPLILGLHRVEPGGALSRTASILGIAVPTILAIGAILDEGQRIVALFAFALVFVGAHLVRDLFPVAWAVFCAVAVFATLVVQQTADVLDDWMFLLLAVLVGVLGALASIWLRFLQKRSA
jgi:hypothetical protein